MSAKQKLEVRIGGRDYTLISEESAEYMHRVAFYVDRKMKEIEDASPRLSISMTAVLTSLNIGDEVLKLRESVRAAEEERNAAEASCADLQKQYDLLREELSSLEKRYQALQIRYAKKETELEDALKNYELGLQNNNLTFDDLT